MLSVGNLAAGFAAGMLPRTGASGTPFLCWPGGAALGYGAMILTGSPWALLARFHIGGRGQGHNAEHQQRAYRGACTGAHEMHESHPCMLCHGVAAVPAVYCGAGYGGLPWWTPMAGLALCGAALWGVFALAGLPGRTGDGARVKNDWSFLRSPRFWVLTGLVFFQNCTEISVTAGW